MKDEKLKVAIDIGPLERGHAIRGIGVHLRELIEKLKELQSERLKFEAVDFEKVDLSEYDLAHYPYFHPYFLTLPFRKKTKTLVTIHDLTPLFFPRTFPPGIKGKLRFLIQKNLLKKTDGIITISQASKRDIVRFLPVSAEKVWVVRLAQRDIFKKGANRKRLHEVRERYCLPAKFVLYVGDVNYNKNVLGLIKACKKVKIPVVIVGRQAACKDFDRNHIENQPLVQLIEQYGEDPEVLRLGFVPDRDLVLIYNLARVYCQPSFYEGFGLPILEAMACGTPVVSAKTGSLPEICGRAALMVDPDNINSLAKGIQKVIVNHQLAASLRKKGFKQAGKFSWRQTAEQTTRVYEEILGQEK